MSHFSVLVIGENPEGQLAPYDENLEAPRYKRYEEASTTEFPRSTAAEDGVDPSDDHAVAAYLNKKWGEEDGRYEVDDVGLYQWTTYNPQSKWDWYELGGRWTGHLLVKEGVTNAVVGRPGLMTPPPKPGRADQARKGDIDFQGMQWAEAQEAADTYDRYAVIAAEHPPARDFTEMVEISDIDARRNLYWSQPLIQALSKANLIPWDKGVTETYGVGREEYIKRAGRTGPTTYAMVAEGVWKGKGRMGWFGMSAEDGDPQDWVDFWWKMVDGLSDDTLLSVYDCHI